MTWKVLAYGADSGSLYIYAVDAPETANEIDVACYAYAKHGISHRDGDVSELLGPHNNVEWVDKPYDG